MERKTEESLRLKDVATELGETKSFDALSALPEAADNPVILLAQD